jgi:urea transport system permease protein
VGLPAAAMPIVWVAFSGRGDITATLVGSFVILLAFQTLTVYSQQAALLLMGALLLCTVMLAPQGFVMGVVQSAGKLLRLRRKVAAQEGSA